MQHDDRPEQLLRLLLSWREAAAAGDRNGPRRAAQDEPVEQAIEACRARYRQEVQRLGADLRKALAKKGDKPTTAKVEALRREIERHNALLRAQTAADLGGAVGLPPALYPAALDKVGLPWRARPVHRTARLMAYLSPTDRKILAALPACLLIAVLAVFYVARWREGVTFEFAPGDGGTVHVICTNGTAHEVVLHAPWMEDTPPRAPGKHYGMHVHVLESEGGDYRLIPSYGSGWYHQGVATAMIEPIRIEPGLSAEVVFDPSELPLAAPPAGTRIVCSGESGGVKARYEIGE